MSRCLILLLLLASLSFTIQPAASEQVRLDDVLTLIDDMATGNMGALCAVEQFRLLGIPLPGTHIHHDATRQKVDLAADMLREAGIKTQPGLLDAVVRSILVSDHHVLAARVLVLNATSGDILALSAWRSSPLGGPPQLDRDLRSQQPNLDKLPWLINRPWSQPYYACSVRRWIISYTVDVSPSRNKGVSGILSTDMDLSDLDVDQCEEKEDSECHITSALKELHKTHKCHASTFCDFVSGHGWSRGSYICRCRPGFYAKKPLQPAFNGTLVEHEYGNYMDNTSSVYMDIFRCHRCEPGCAHCVDSSPCLANYNWPFRIALLTVSCICVAMTLVLIGYMAQHHRLKVFKVASPIFLSITLLGCAIMYLEMAAIFPVLDMYSCIATKWARHLGFCVTYTALLMKTWRVSLTYRVKSAHKVKLTDKQLLQWMFPILLVMLIYLGTWTLSAPPQGEDILDNAGLRFKQCTYNWWDHSLAIGEVLFLAWGIRVCYNVRHAESLYNEARLITYAIYNIAAVNIAMVAFHLMIFPRAGPDIKYLLGFIRTQLGTSTTVALVFGPKVYRVLRGQGDQYDSRARARGVTASFSLNGIGLVSEEPPDLYQENEELKEEIQKLAAQIEFMRIVHMEMNNRHLKPKPGGYFSGGSKSHLRPEPSDTDAPAL